MTRRGREEARELKGMGSLSRLPHSQRRLRRRRRGAMRDDSPIVSSLFRASRALALTGGLLLSGATGVHSASAGTYVMRNCDVPGHPNSLLGPWYVDDLPPSITTVDACATGGGVGFRIVASQLSPGDSAVLVLRRPHEGPQLGIQLVKASLWYAARLAGSGQELNVFSLDFRSNPPVLPWLINGPPGSENLSFEQEFNPTETHLYKVGFECGPISSPRPPGACVPNHAMPFQVRGMEVVLSEETPPIVLRPGGTLLERGPQSGARTVTYAVSDPQSGLALIEVLLGGTVVARHDLTSRCSYSDWTVCPASRDDTLTIDTRTVANGSHRLTIRARDAAGNEAVADGDTAIEVFNAPTPAPSAESNNVQTYALSARFKDSSRSTLTVPYGKRISVSGRLTQGSQPAAAGTVVEVLEKLDRRGAREVSVARVEAKADGSLSTVLLTTKPSRRLRLAYRPARGSQVLSRSLRLRVRAAARLRASLRGRVLRFGGRVLSGPLPRSGKRVQMEGRSPGSAWTAFKIVRTDRKGRFSGTYRLRVRRPGVTLKVRAAVPIEAGYGYQTSRSQAVTLRVR